MTETFADRKAPVSSPEPLQATQPTEAVNDTLTGVEKQVEDPITEEEKKLEIWEGLKNKRFVDEYFDTHNTSSDFTIKMPTSEIDKYVKAELETLGYEKTTDNYKKVLSEIEEQIGSTHLELSKRFTKITGYIRILNKIALQKKLKAKYLNQDED